MGNFSHDEKSYLGGVSVKVKTPDLDIKGKKQVAEFRRAMRLAHTQGISEGEDILKEILEDKGIEDTGDLIESVSHKLFIKTDDIFEGDVHFNHPGKEYAYFVEHGRKAGLPPPIGVMTEWAERHGIDYTGAMKIRAKIGRKGTKPRPFFSKAQRRIQSNYQKVVDRAIKRFIRNK
jgi:hypothetical protein